MDIGSYANGFLMGMLTTILFLVVIANSRNGDL